MILLRFKPRVLSCWYVLGLTKRYAVKVSNANFLEYISDKRFVIPNYQRRYQWNKDQCGQLFKDLRNLVAKTKDSSPTNANPEAFDAEVSNENFVAETPILECKTPDKKPKYFFGMLVVKPLKTEKEPGMDRDYTMSILVDG